MTAQKVFAESLRTVVAPALRGHGLGGSGQSYWLPDESVWLQVGFQKSVSSTATAVKFTVNLSAVRKAAWDAVRREHSYVKDTPPPGVGADEWEVERLAQSYFPKKPRITGGEGIRLGQLLPGDEGGDRWWVVTPDDSGGVKDCLNLVVSYGLPWLRAEAEADSRRS